MDQTRHLSICHSLPHGQASHDSIHGYTIVSLPVDRYWLSQSKQKAYVVQALWRDHRTSYVKKPPPLSVARLLTSPISGD